MLDIDDLQIIKNIFKSSQRWGGFQMVGNDGPPLEQRENIFGSKYKHSGYLTYSYP